jgi:hypothetical protein
MRTLRASGWVSAVPDGWRLRGEAGAIAMSPGGDVGVVPSEVAGAFRAVRRTGGVHVVTDATRRLPH